MPNETADDLREPLPVRSSQSGVFCSQCNKTFSRPENLIRHVRAAHTNNAIYACTGCYKRFTRSDLLKKHEKTHSNHRLRSQAGTQSRNISSPMDDGVREEIEAVRATQELTDDLQSKLPWSTPDGNTPHTRTRLPAASNFVGTGHPYMSFPNQASSGDMELGFGEGLLDVDLSWTLDYFPLSSTAFDTVLPVTGELASKLDGSSGNTRLISTDQVSDFVVHPGGSRARIDGDLQSSTAKEFSQARYVELEEINAFQHRLTPPSVKNISIGEETAQKLLQIVSREALVEYCGRGPFQEEFPAISTLVYFVQLYFVKVYPRFPLIHRPTFTQQPCSGELLLAIIISGSCYAESNRGNFRRMYLKRLRIAVTLDQEKSDDYFNDITNLLTLFLVCLTATWAGDARLYRRAESDRGLLVSACRRNRLLDCRDKRHSSGPRPTFEREPLERTWLKWIEQEQRKRLGLCIYLFDCQWTGLLQRQPLISKAETANAILPCASLFWEASSAEAWKLQLGPAEIPPSVYHLATLSSILLGKEISDVMSPPIIDDFGKLLYICVLHTHIFEWRQAVCMLNTNGLRDSPISFAPQHIGEGLLDRQRWLIGALDCWFDAYGSPQSLGVTQDVSSSLMYYLARLALNVNFSDLYVIAGRSGSQEDISLAVQSLRNQLANDSTFAILNNAVSMVDDALDVVNKGQIDFCSTEVAVVLFIGGLIFWAIDHTLQVQELTNYLNLQQQQSSLHLSQNMSGPISPSRMEPILRNRTMEVTTALFRISSVGFASVFASVLNNLCEFDHPTESVATL